MQEDGTVLPLRQTELYQEDWLGLKKLDGMGRLHLLSKPVRRHPGVGQLALLDRAQHDGASLVAL